MRRTAGMSKPDRAKQPKIPGAAGRNFTRRAQRRATCYPWIAVDAAGNAALAFSEGEINMLNAMPARAPSIVRRCGTCKLWVWARPSGVWAPCGRRAGIGDGVCQGLFLSSLSSLRERAMSVREADVVRGRGRLATQNGR